MSGWPVVFVVVCLIFAVVEVARLQVGSPRHRLDTGRELVREPARGVVPWRVPAASDPESVRERQLRQLIDVARLFCPADLVAEAVTVVATDVDERHAMAERDQLADEVEAFLRSTFGWPSP